MRPRPDRALRHFDFRSALLATAAVPLLTLGSPAFAQDAQADAVALDAPASDEAMAAADEDIVVTGLRQTIQSSINTKRLETAVVDALSSEEIGALPALSVGEAIQTITGATTHREKGGASEIAIRGLGPFLSNATFNGRDASNGSGDRSVNFNQFPSELINGIKIYKTQQADLVEGGVAGTIELETLKPLDYGKRRIQAEFKGSYSPYQDRIYQEDGLGWRGTISYVDQFSAGALGDFGISLGVQRNSVANPEETVAGSSTWTACSPNAVVNANCTAVTREQAAAGTPFFLAPNSIAFRQISESDRRDSLFGALQWQPNDTIDINLDVQYSDRKYAEQRNDLNFSEMRYRLRNVQFDENGVITRAEGRSSIETVSTLLERGEEYLGGGLDISFKPVDRLTLRADLSYSRTKRSEIERSVRLRTDALDVYGNRTAIGDQRIPYVYEVLDGNFAPTITVDPRFDITNHNLFSDDTRIRRDQQDRNNKILAGRFDATYEVDGAFLSKLDAGVRYSRLTYNDFDDRVEVNLDTPAAESAANLACRTIFQQRDYLSAAEGNTINNWATFDPLCLVQSHMGTDDPGRNADIRDPANRDVTENTLSAYVMASYDSDLGNMPIRGNVGVRVVNTKVRSDGLRSGIVVVHNTDGSIRLVSNDDYATVTTEHETTRFLPSANAIFEIQPDLLLRLAAYRAMSKPAPSALGAGRAISVSGSNVTSIGDAISEIKANGSPRLEPLMSWNADASLEYYLNKDSMFSGALYYKKFNGGFIPVRYDEQFVIDGENVTVPVVQTANSDRKSRIWGYELTLTHRFSWLPGALSGLGTKLSYNYANSNFENEDVNLGDIMDPVTGVITEGMIPPANISGFSKHVLSAQAYYQLGGLSLQAIYNYRSNYYQDFVGGNTQLRYVRGNDTVDFRASYDLNRNVQLKFEAVNIFDEPKVTDMPVQGSIRQYHYYGARYFMGVRFRI
ncbi:TonB-dependent receptor [Sphingomonas sp. LY54]|uniref:TonB-dependent receptor n=1 Tax=Sphingomonas sp. LY54 TaxID=3095343 RepID=UPI002D76F826|nr:TonB-dependent receptor [Sphingomonas sp. LY54]WRP28382.1 TonB-dependent receptor [Sphingomonas sp. LY54]